MQSLIAELQAGSPKKENQPQQPQGQKPSEHQAAGKKTPRGQPQGQQPQASTGPGPSKPVLGPTRRNVQHSSAANRQAAMRQQLEVSHALLVQSLLVLMALLIAMPLATNQMFGYQAVQMTISLLVVPTP